MRNQQKSVCITLVIVITVLLRACSIILNLVPVRSRTGARKRESKAMSVSAQRRLTLTHNFYGACATKNSHAGRELARNFLMSPNHVSCIFATWINFLGQELEQLTKLPTREAVAQSLLKSFKVFENTRLVFDAALVRIQRPSSPHQKLTWTDYVNNVCSKASRSVDIM